MLMVLGERHRQLNHLPWNPLCLKNKINVIIMKLIMDKQITVKRILLKNK